MHTHAHTNTQGYVYTHKHTLFSQHLMKQKTDDITRPTTRNAHSLALLVLVPSTDLQGRFYCTGGFDDLIFLL